MASQPTFRAYNKIKAAPLNITANNIREHFEDIKLQRKQRRKGKGAAAASTPNGSSVENEENNDYEEYNSYPENNNEENNNALARNNLEEHYKRDIQTLFSALIPYLMRKGYNFGYESDDDPVTYDPNNILNILIELIAKDDSKMEQHMLGEIIYEVLPEITGYEPKPVDWHVPWQLFVRLGMAHRNKELKYIGLQFSNKTLLWLANLAVMTFNNKLLLELLNNFDLPINTGQGKAMNEYYVEEYENQIDENNNENNGNVEEDNVIFGNNDENNDNAEWANDPNWVKRSKLTNSDLLLHSAVIAKNYDAAKLLMDKGADPLIKDEHKLNACQLARDDVKMMSIVCPHPLTENTKQLRQYLLRTNNTVKAVNKIKNITNKKSFNRRSHILTIAPQYPRAGAGGPAYNGGKRRTRRASKHRKRSA